VSSITLKEASSDLLTDRRNEPVDSLVSQQLSYHTCSDLIEKFYFKWFLLKIVSENQKVHLVKQNRGSK